MRSPGHSPSQWLATAALFAAGAAHAAGGHFDVDDATVEDPGHCVVETWGLRSPAPSATTLHLGGACRAGAVEVGANLDGARRGGDTQRGAGPQVKWVADPLIERLSLGAAWAVSFGGAGAPAVSHTAYVPLTWWASEHLQIHLNAGSDWQSGNAHTPRWGAAAQWNLNDACSLTLERSLIATLRTTRLGASLNLARGLSVDVSIARQTAADRAVYAVGLNQDFGGH